MKLLMENWKKFLKEEKAQIDELSSAARAFVKISQDPKADARTYIPLLQKIASDPEFKAIASAGKTDGAPDDESFNITPGSVKASNLRATQKEIGLSNSLLDQLKQPSWAPHPPAMNALGLKGSPIEMLCKDSRCAILTFGPIDGGYRILDGHHRWSQVMMMNPDGVVAIDNLEPEGVLSTPENALKLMQLAIALKAGKAVTIPFEGQNLMDVSAEEVYQYTLKNISDETLKLLVATKKIESPDKEVAAKYIAGNLRALQARKGFSHLTRKGVMPQAADSGTSQGAVNQAIQSGEINFSQPSPSDVKKAAE
jgi:hypothetical protein|tara:strand:+ start:492 stop:1424 length:933 start_codon:yes stop_codon:yes gene_type:complete